MPLLNQPFSKWAQANIGVSIHLQEDFCVCPVSTKLVNIFCLVCHVYPPILISFWKCKKRRFPGRADQNTGAELEEPFRKIINFFILNLPVPRLNQLFSKQEQGNIRIFICL